MTTQVGTAWNTLCVGEVMALPVVAIGEPDAILEGRDGICLYHSVMICSAAPATGASRGV